MFDIILLTRYSFAENYWYDEKVDLVIDLNSIRIFQTRVDQNIKIFSTMYAMYTLGV